MNEAHCQPIILIPGIARFDFLRSALIQHTNSLLDGRDLKIESDLTHYFKGIRTYLQECGYVVAYGYSGFAEAVDVRRRLLRRSVNRVLREHDADQVHLIGHSMGGIDARYLVATEADMAAKVCTVTTIGTPHLGTSFAEYVLRKAVEGVIDWANEAVRLDLRGFQLLTPAKMSDLNDSLLEAEVTNDVTYFAYAAWQARRDIFAPLQHSWDIVKRQEGDNDGLVSAASQRWYETLVFEGQAKTIHQRDFPLQADHLNTTGRWEMGELALLPETIIAQQRRFEAAIKQAYLHMAQEANRYQAVPA